MKKRVSILLLALILIISLIPIEESKASNNRKVLRVGMEVANAPFNWSQTNNSNGAVPVVGTQEYANGYDVQIAKKIADELGMDLEIVKIEWDGLLPAVQSGKIDAIIAGMSPTPDRKKVLDFTINYYETDIVLVTRSDSKYKDAKTLSDFTGARVVAQLNTIYDPLVEQIPEVNHLTPMPDFPTIRVALQTGKVDAYVAEKPEAISAEIANDIFKMIELEDGFKTNPEDTQIAIGLNKGSELLEPINSILSNISVEQQKEMMNNVIEIQLGIKNTTVWDIFTNNAPMFLRGTLYTIIISLIGTIVGLLIGFIIGMIKSAQKVKNAFMNLLLSLLKILSNVYVQVIRGTPMMVQAVLFYYGLQLFFDIDMAPMTAAFIIVSINTGAYMAEIVRAGINSIDTGQEEAAKALGMSHIQMMKFVILPQVFKNIIPNIGNEFIVNIKDTSVLNVISVNELFFTTRSIAGANFRFFETYFITSVIYLTLTLSITGLLRLLEKKLNGSGSYEKVIINHSLNS